MFSFEIRINFRIISQGAWQPCLKLLECNTFENDFLNIDANAKLNFHHKSAPLNIFIARNYPFFWLDAIVDVDCVVLLSYEIGADVLVYSKTGKVSFSITLDCKKRCNKLKVCDRS